MISTFLMATLMLAAGAAIVAMIRTQPSEDKGNLVHNVYFWFRDDVSRKDYQNFYSELQKLQKVPAIMHGWIGVPADTEERDVVDQSYDYSITFVFADEKSEAIYQSHPIHKEFINRNSQLWERVVVYDMKTP